MFVILSQAVRVLMVLPYPPTLEGGAASRCAIGLMRGLNAYGEDVQCTALAAGYGVRQSLPEGLQIDVVDVERATPTLRARLSTRAHAWAYPLGVLTKEPFAAALRARAPHADIVHFVEAEAAQAMRLVDRPTVVQLNCLTLRDREIGLSWRRENRASFELLRAERRARRRGRWFLASSPQIADELARGHPGAHVQFAPFALDPMHYAPSATLERPVVGLIGTASWPPTARAVRRLLTRVWPLVHARAPDAQLLLAGKGMLPATFGEELAHIPGVSWRGPVPSAVEFLRELGVLLYPLDAGSGIKVKVLEALALGLPVVTTPDGAEGLLARTGLFVERDDERLTAATLDLLASADARRAMGAQAKENFARNHSPAAAAAPVVELYRRVLA